MPVAKRNNLTKKIITEAIVKRIGFSESFIEKFIDNTFNEIKNSLTKNGVIKIKNFGVLKLIKKKKRIGRNPKTKEKHEIKERFVINFKTSKKLKEKINNG